MAPNSDHARVVGLPGRDIALELAESGSGSRRTSLQALLSGHQAGVVDFFAPWCKACPAAAQKLDGLAAIDAYAERCLFLLICVDGDVEEARGFAQEHGIRNCAVATADEDEDLLAKYGVSGLPHHVLLSGNGTVAGNYDVDLPVDFRLCSCGGGRRRGHRDRSGAAGPGGSREPGVGGVQRA